MQSSKGVWRVGNRRGGQTVEFRVHNPIRDGGPVTQDTLAAKSPCAKFACGVSKWWGVFLQCAMGEQASDMEGGP